LNYWCHPINNGRMEGTNNKIKTLNRQAYGYRDEEFFILKLLARLGGFDLRPNYFRFVSC